MEIDKNKSKASAELKWISKTKLVKLDVRSLS